MRIGLPSRFTAVSLLVLLALAVASVLILPQILHPRSELLNGKAALHMYYAESSAIEHDILAPDPPALHEQLGELNSAVRLSEFWMTSELVTYDNNKSVSHDLHIHLGQRIGWPLSTVKRQTLASGSITNIVWPENGKVRVTYYPLGLILNPIIYALPIWLIMMGIRWVFIARRSRKRERLGLCVGCAYELGELQTCPECGRGREGRKHPSPA